MNRGTVQLSMLLLSVAALGCGGGSNLDLRPVSGVLTWDGGDPVADASITFMPEDGGPSSTAKTDSDGSFELRTGTGASGAVVGKHKVVVTRPTEDTKVDFNDPSSLQRAAAGRDGGQSGRSSPGGNTNTSDATIPAAYTKASDTPLNYDVTADGSHGSLSFVLNKS